MLYRSLDRSITATPALFVNKMGVFVLRSTCSQIMVKVGVLIFCLFFVPAALVDEHRSLQIREGILPTILFRATQNGEFRGEFRGQRATLS